MSETPSSVNQAPAKNRTTARGGVSTTRDSGGNQRVSNGLVALSSAVVVAVYATGYLRTQAAADQFDAEAGQRRPGPAVPLDPPAVGATIAAAIAPASQASSSPIAAPLAEPTLATDTTTAPPPNGRTASKAASTTSPVPAEAVVAAVPPAPVGPAIAPSAPAPSTSDTAAPPAPASAGLTEPVAVVAPVAPAAPVAPVAPIAPVPPKPRYKDGTFTGWGTSRHGDIQAQVIVVDGRITSATIAQCMTRWPCSWIAALPGQVVTRQSPETDYVSGATQSTNAFYYAVVQALGKAVAE